MKRGCLVVMEPEIDSLSKDSSLPGLVSAADLYDKEIVSARPLLDGLAWDGLTMLIARPKAGKSWFTLQLAVAVAGGRKVDGVTVLNGGPVLYGAFEEPQARTISRLRKVSQTGGEWSKQLHFLYDLLPLMEGGDEQLETAIAHIKPRLVVLDTLTALLKGGKRDSDVFRNQYAEVSRIRKLAEDFKTAIILVHHVRKGVSDSGIEAVAGTGGIAAAIDTLWHLKRKAEGEATLDIIGRETEEGTFALRFDQEPFGWRLLGNDVLQLLNSERREILDLLRDESGLTPAQISAELAKSRPATRKLLQRMRCDDQVIKTGQKYYPSPTHTVSHRVTEREKESV